MRLTLDFEMDSEIYIDFSIRNQLLFSVVPFFSFYTGKQYFAVPGTAAVPQKNEVPGTAKNYRQVEILHRMCPPGKNGTEEDPEKNKTFSTCVMKLHIVGRKIYWFF